MKRILTFLLAAVSFTALVFTSPGSNAGFENFHYSGGYVAGQYSDVSDTDWFSRYVEDACNYGFFRGKNEDKFDPGGKLTFGEAMMLVVRFSCMFNTGSADFTEYDPFYAVYAEYALEHGIIKPGCDFAAPVTRAQFASLICTALRSTSQDDALQSGALQGDTPQSDTLQGGVLQGDTLPGGAPQSDTPQSDTPPESSITQGGAPQDSELRDEVETQSESQSETQSESQSETQPETQSEALNPINHVPDYGICDVISDMTFADFNNADLSYAGDVYLLYRAGILSGSDSYGTFSPEAVVTRAEACAIMVRLADPLARVRAVPPARIPAEVIYERSIDAVFLLETFDKDGESIRTGTGFFITDTGYAVTNLHVIDNAASAEITLSNGDVFPVLGVNAKSEEYNLIIFSIDFNAGENEKPAEISYLRLGDSDSAVEGSTVYALGNPLALVHTITDGIVANTYREVDGNIFFQFTAPISFGSGGSPVLNTLGQVVGVASSSFSYGQNMNLAVPANFIKELRIGKYVPLGSL